MGYKRYIIALITMSIADSTTLTKKQVIIEVTVLQRAELVRVYYNYIKARIPIVRVQHELHVLFAGYALILHHLRPDSSCGNGLWLS